MNNIIERILNEDIQEEQNILKKQKKQELNKNFRSINPEYFKNYYQNKLKDNYFYCFACKHEYLISHKL